MRIAYVASWRGGSRTGPFKKMREQAGAWAAAGHEVGMFVVTSDAAAADWAQVPQSVRVEAASRPGLATIAARRRLHTAVRAWQPEVVYLRHGLTSPGLARLVSRFPTVIEVNGDDVAIAASSSRAKAIWARAARGQLLHKVDGAVFMTNELAASPRFSAYQIESIVIPNGIDLDEIGTMPANTSGRPRLVLLGHPHSPWHGTDKLLDLAQRRPDWDFDVIGPDEADLGAPPPPNLRMHAECTEEEYLPILARADIGIGSLAMHRIHSEENPALKVREYLARGLAVLTGCHDPDFPQPTTFLLELPNTENNLRDHEHEIIQFVHAWHGRRVDRALIKHLDLGRKEAQRLEFIERTLATAKRSPTG